MQSSNIKLPKNFFPSKKMGQNFLFNENIINKIDSLLPNLTSYDCILEIGAGFGSLTEKLVDKNKKVICIELDKRLYENLIKKFSNVKNLILLNDDFLKIDLDNLLAEYKKIIVIANIPYSITSPIIAKCLYLSKIISLYIMVQKEFAIKLDYTKTKNRNAFVNIVNYYFLVSQLLTVEKQYFTPQPKVDSKFIHLQRKKQLNYDKKFYQFIQMFFLAKRKKILNNLPSRIDRQAFANMLLKLGYDLNVRAEILTYDDWMIMYNKFGNLWD